MKHQVKPPPLNQHYLTLMSLGSGTGVIVTGGKDVGSAEVLFLDTDKICPLPVLPIKRRVSIGVRQFDCKSFEAVSHLPVVRDTALRIKMHLDNVLYFSSQ